MGIPNHGHLKLLAPQGQPVPSQPVKEQAPVTADAPALEDEFAAFQREIQQVEAAARDHDIDGLCDHVGCF